VTLERDEMGRIPMNVRPLTPDGTDPGGYNARVATIASGQQLSGEIDTSGESVAAIIMPSAWTAAVITFQGAHALVANGGVYADVYDDNGNELQIQAAASRAIGIDAASRILSGYRFLKVRSGTSASGVTQTPARTLQLLTKLYR
jgi:hypothetical protein